MIKVAITLEGSPEEMVSVIQFISDQPKEGVALNEKTSTATDQTEEGKLIWTEKKIRAVYWGVSYNCRWLLKEVAKHKDGIDTPLLSKILGVDNERGIGGVLSSLGRVLNDPRYEDLPRPLDWIMFKGYKMIPIWKDTVIKIMEEEKNFIASNDKEV